MRDEASNRAYVSANLMNWSSLGTMKSWIRLSSGKLGFSLCISPDGQTYLVSSDEETIEIEVLERFETMCRMRVANRIQEIGYQVDQDQIFQSDLTKRPRQ